MKELTGTSLGDVGRLALGCATFGNLYRVVSDDDVQGTVDAAWARGIRLFDTAPFYGLGLSEVRLGRALAGRPRDEYVVASKVGRLLVPLGNDEVAEPTIFADIPAVRAVFDFSYDGVLRSLDASLERLGVDRIDLLHVHDPDEHLDAAEAGAFPALLRLRDEGVVRAVGLGTNLASVANHMVGQVDLDWLLLAGRGTLLDRSGQDVFDRCAEHGVRVLAAGVFNSGVLAAPADDATFHYEPVPPDVLVRVRAMEAECQRAGVPLAAAAVQLPLRHPAVDTVLVGARNAAEIDLDADLLDVLIPDGLWDRLARAVTGTTVALVPIGQGANVLGFDEVVRARRSVRQYQARAVPDEVVAEILDLARHAPSSMGLQPWHFVVVREPAILERLAKAKDEFCLPDKRESHPADFVTRAPVLVAVCVDVRRSGRRERENGVIAATFVLLAAASRGLSGVYMTAYHPDDPGLAAAVTGELGLPPHVQAVALLPLGFPTQEPPAKELAPLASHVHQEHFTDGPAGP